MESARDPFLRRARLAASLTIPGLLPAEGADGSTDLPQPFQSIGADGVNNLSSQLLLVLFPTGSSFVRLTVDEVALEKAVQQAAGEDPRGELEEALGKIERAMMNRMDKKGARSVNFEVLQHLIVTGNALQHIMDDGSVRMFPLDSYVVKRDLEGQVIDIVVKECMARVAAPEKVRAMLTETSSDDGDTASGKEATVELYTWIKRVNDKSWTVSQEVEGKQVEDSPGTYPEGKCPWLPLRWRIVPRNDYGRGRCEEYIGDLLTVDTGSEAIVRFGAAAAKILFFCEPGGQTDAAAASRAKSGDFITGSVKDIGVLMLEKSQDFQVLKLVVDEAKSRLERAFLMASAVQRNAERVTAEEIRAMIGQLDQTLGGQYALLAEDWQRPTAVVHLHQMQKDGDLPPLPSKLIQPQIVAGLEGLGRNSDFQKLQALVGDLGAAFGPEAVAKYVHVGAFANRLGTALGIDLTGIVRSDDDVEKQEQAAAQAQMAQNIAPKLVDAGVQGMQNAQDADASPQPQTQA